MKVEPTGIVLVDICSIQTDRCIARVPTPITAVWTLPGRVQVNVCRPCLEEQVRSGEWEIQGARIRSRADVAVYSGDKRLQLVVEVKRKPRTGENLRNLAIRIRRNLITHSGSPSAPFFLVAILPGRLFLWKEGNRSEFEREPDYEMDDNEVLRQYFNDISSPETASEFQLEAIISTWLNVLAKSSNVSSDQHDWLEDSGLLKAISNGNVVTQAPIAA